MSIFSSIGNFVSSAASSVGNFLSGAYNTVAGLFTGGASNTASAGNYNAPSGGTSYNNLMTPTPKGGGYSAAPYTPIPSGGSYSAAPVYGPQLPVNINAGSQSTSKGGSTGSSSGINSSGGVGFNAYGPVAPTTISAKSLGVTSPVASKSTTGGGATSLASTGGGGATPITLSSTPTSINPSGGIDNTKLAGAVAGYYKLNDKGQLEQTVDPQAQTDQQTAEKTKSLYDSILGVKPTVAQDSEVIAARNQRQQIQQALLGPTSELNAVVAKQNQDLLQLRQTGSKEGVTEAVYGGQSNAINYNAAIRALPLQAQISGLQGDLKLAQDYLNELSQVKQDQINNQYEYNKNLFNSISDKIDKKDAQTYEAMKTENERAYNESTNLIKTQASLLQNAVAQKAPQSIINAINNAKDIKGAVTAAGNYGISPDTQLTQLDNGQTVLIDKRTGKIVSNIGGAKQTGVADLAGLTPEQAADPFVKKLAASAGGKPITDTFAQQLNKGLTVLGQIGSLQTNIKDVKTGPIVGLFKGANPWDTNAQTIKAQLNAIIPNLARGVYGEVGVLTDNDVAQYSKTLPNLQSPEDVRNAVLGITVDTIGKSIKRTLEINAANGKDVSKFIDIYTEMQNTRDSIFSSIPGYKGASQSQQVAPEVQSLRTKYNY